MFWIILRLGLDWRAFWFLGEGGMEECLAGNVWAGHLPLLFSMTYGTQTWQRGGLLRGAGGGIRQTEETEETFWHSTANAHAAFPIFSLVKTLWFVSFLTHGCAVVASGWLFLNIRFSHVSFAPRIFKPHLPLQWNTKQTFRFILAVPNSDHWLHVCYLRLWDVQDGV